MNHTGKRPRAFQAFQGNTEEFSWRQRGHILRCPSENKRNLVLPLKARPELTPMNLTLCLAHHVSTCDSKVEFEDAVHNGSFHVLR